MCNSMCMRQARAVRLCFDMILTLMRNGSGARDLLLKCLNEITIMSLRSIVICRLVEKNNDPLKMSIDLCSFYL